MYRTLTRHRFVLMCLYNNTLSKHQIVILLLKDKSGDILYVYFIIVNTQ